MNTRAILVVFGFLAFGLSGCAVTDISPSADFSAYKTYAWGESNIDVSNPLYDSDLIDARIRNAVKEEFSKRGIVESKTDPDFIVRYHTFTEEKVRQSGSYPYGYGFHRYGFFPFGLGWYPYYWMIPPPPPNTTQFTEGTLVVDIVDNRTDELIWRGSVTGDVDNVSALNKQIEKGVKAIMKKYPVSPDEPLRLDSEAVS